MLTTSLIEGLSDAFGFHEFCIKSRNIFGHFRIIGGLLLLQMAHNTATGSRTPSYGIRRVKTSQRMMPKLNTSHFSVYLFELNTSGAIQSGVPLLFDMIVSLTRAVPKSQIFSIRPKSFNKRLQKVY